MQYYMYLSVLQHFYNYTRTKSVNFKMQMRLLENLHFSLCIWDTSYYSNNIHMMHMSSQLY